MDNFEEEFFEHYGIKGMKWGVRRSREQLARLRGDKSPKTPSKKSGRDARLSSISDKELQSRINRLNMEKNYKRLLAEAAESNKSPTAKALAKGREEVQGVLVNAGKEAIKNYASSQFQVGLTKGIPVVAGVVSKVIKR